MPIKNVYLTIDDSPSKYMHKKIEFLLAHKIPALFFCRGEFISEHGDKVINAIQNGFVIGNHSYSHPCFSEIPLEACFEEINKTETLIDDCYQQANCQRPYKVIRLAFGDRGAGKHAALATTEAQLEKVTQIQVYLNAQGFVPLDFTGRGEDDFIDGFWTWDTQDYKSRLIENPPQYTKQLESFWQQSTQETHILLLHDFDHNQPLFESTMEFLLSKNINFLPFKTVKR